MAVSLIAHEVYGLLETHVVRVTPPGGGPFLSDPQLHGMQRGGSILATLSGVDQQGRFCEVQLSREMLDRGCPRKNYSTLNCYDASGTRIKLEFFEPVSYLGANMG